MKSLMIYPYNNDLYSFVRHNDLLINKYNLSSVISTEDSGLYNRKIYGSDFIIKSDYFEALKNCDAIFFNEWNTPHYQKDKLYKKIDIAIKTKKDIITNIAFEKNVIHKIKLKCEREYVTITILNSNNEVETFIPSHLYNIETPVLFVGSFAENCNKFEIQLTLRKLLTKKGYRVSQIGTKNYCELFGFHSFPKFMFNKQYSEVEKILLFNKYVYDIEEKEHPDIIIIGLPGSIMLFNKVIHYNFGIIPYLISQALHPDFTVISTLFDNYVATFFDKMKNLVLYRFGYDIDCININNNIIDSYQSEFNEITEYLRIDINIVENKVRELRKQTKTPVINIFNSNDAEYLCNLTINQLSYNETSKYSVPDECKIVNKNINFEEIYNSVKIIINRILLSEQKNIKSEEEIFFSARCMSYLYLEIIREFGIIIPEKYINAYEFNNIESICNIIYKKLKSIDDFLI